MTGTVDIDGLGYDPEVAPDPRAWLALDEGERCRRVEAWHRASDEPLPEELTVHVALQTTIENQIALGMSSVAQACQRLRGEGLTRHDALHAIGVALVDYMQSLLRGDRTPAECLANYEAALGRLDAAAWYALLDEA
jgi:hypothetical protein